MTGSAGKVVATSELGRARLQDVGQPACVEGSLHRLSSSAGLDARPDEAPRVSIENDPRFTLEIGTFMGIGPGLIGMDLHREVLAGIEKLDEQRKSALRVQWDCPHNVVLVGVQYVAEGATGEGAACHYAARTLAGHIGKFPRFADGLACGQLLANILEALTSPDLWDEDRYECEWGIKHGWSLPQAAEDVG
jgi:hypothetical protein